jgi:hypothetical protein
MRLFASDSDRPQSNRASARTRLSLLSCMMTDRTQVRFEVPVDVRLHAAQAQVEARESVFGAVAQGTVGQADPTVRRPRCEQDVPRSWPPQAARNSRRTGREACSKTSILSFASRTTGVRFSCRSSRRRTTLARKKAPSVARFGMKELWIVCTQGFELCAPPGNVGGFADSLGKARVHIQLSITKYD